MKFPWDEAKNRATWARRNVSFEEAASAFGDPLSVTVSDTLHSDREQRLVTIGVTGFGRLVVVVHTERAAPIRIISARRATRRERGAYERGK